MKRIFLVSVLIILTLKGFCWGFYGHRLINYQAVFVLPPEMIFFYKPHIQYISSHAVDPDKRRYAVLEEGPRHYIDMDIYCGISIPRSWTKAVEKFSEDSLMLHGIVPWWVQVMLARLTKAFKEKNVTAILKLSAETGHYLGDAHVPLHTSANHNGQLTGQQGIHGFWESRLPEIYAETEWDLFAGRAMYIKNPLEFTWKRVEESALASDSVLQFEKRLNATFTSDKKYAYEKRNGVIIKQYSADYSSAYNKILNGMVERRLRQSVFAVASFWYTAWVNAGQPNLKDLSRKELSEDDQVELNLIEMKWKKEKVKGRSCE
ncbi:MAG TPA: zinc dependent phospholipase C family protein [Flavitalea sp.]|nr:zinc dependent phospholipase C family protein [Flavitalea sp.]